MATLSNLVTETTNIKNNLITCHTNLKNKLELKGVAVSSTDKMTDLINKIDDIKSAKVPAWYSKGNFWSKVNMPIYGYDAALCATDKYIYSFGGGGSPSKILGKFDVETGSAFTSSIVPVAIEESAACSIDNTNVYCIGGRIDSERTTNTNYFYDASSNTITEKARQSNSVCYHSLVPYGKLIHSLGGTMGYNKASTSHECYDTTTNTWTFKKSLPTSMGDCAAVKLNDLIYAAFTASTSSYIVYYKYDPTANTWTSSTPVQSTGYYLDAHAIKNKIIFVGKYDGNVVLHDPKTLTDKRLSTLTDANRYCNTVMHDEILYYIDQGNSKFYTFANSDIN